MRASTELFLYDLWFVADTFLRPSWRNVLGPDFDRWAWCNGLSRRLAQLERQNLLEQHPVRATDSERIVRRTETGRLVALGGRDPIASWARPWDGRWRILLFDLPVDAGRLRMKLHRVLREHYFGYLQGSVWLTPHPVEDLRKAVSGVPLDPESFVVFEGRPVTGESDAAVVGGAWNFAEINRRYERYLEVLRTAPKSLPAGGSARERVRVWTRREQAAWKEAVAIDPLLPLSLLPGDYRGRTAWSTRCETIAQVARLITQGA